ncbi:FAD-binding protein [Octadecabacter sp. 1_MG-2023]|uniref:FAD-binding protein n=1 Tax=unclassified Octadecabacter TaxID=196158 RepID=UPI001C09ACD9|nr:MULTISPECIES: FAD-binding protein [unclassified Octadecabacter]MBU2994316.1 FAD-binding protein [Octadecabacter sp. B2R22]MDO6734395.1 FAD-binding protein [Octadecabacter sp. 1_MG-2023]
MKPTTERDLAEAIASAKGPLRITGGGTRDVGNPVVGDALSTAALSGITLYEPGALTIVAQAGTPVSEIEAALDAENQRLAFEPMDHRTLLGTQGTPTVGGMVAANVSGPRRIAVGACRDHLLGVRFVDGAGTVIKNGGRVMKNVTGYDLVKLLAGSYGTLGVLSEVSLKVLPKPETEATLVLNDLSLENSVAAMSAALGSPFEVTGAGKVKGQTCIRIEGFEASVRYRAEQLTALLSKHSDVDQIEHKASGSLWRGIADVSGFADHAAVTRVSVKPSAAPALGVKIAGQHNVDVMLDWGGGLMWFGMMQDDAAAVAHQAIQDSCAQINAHATLIKAPIETRAAVPVFQPENPTITALSDGIRAKFDPRGILNPGLMG